VRRIARKVTRKLSRWVERHVSGIAYWELRTRRLGARAVFDQRHTDAEMAAVTERQRSVLLPLLKQQLDGSERVALDYGCGTGRFTADIANCIHGLAVGVDPVNRLLDYAPPAENTEFSRLPDDGAIPLADGATDLIWICAVLGGIADDDLPRVVHELLRVLAPRGLLFVVENTGGRPAAGKHWQSRPVETYQHMFADAVLLRPIGEYDGLNGRISVFAGRRATAI
jgi:SAM-dependent methyltransferase